MRRALVIAVLTLLAMPGGAHAAFPGENGKIAFSAKLGSDANFHLYTVNPDGTGQTQITFGAADDLTPAWSPDGAQIAFWSSRSDPSPGIYVANADGTGVHRIATPGSAGPSPSWSPDGTRLAYQRGGGEIWTLALDGSAPQQVTSSDFGGPECAYGASRPRWAPDGAYIAYRADYLCPQESSYLEVIAADGSLPRYFIAGYPGPFDWSPYAHELISASAGDTFTYDRFGGSTVFPPYTFFLGAGVVWSPDGTRLLMQGPFNTAAMFTMNFDESGRQELAAVSAVNFGGFDWQPILKGYPRVKGAAPVNVALVPAYAACDTPNRVHAPPVAAGSCAPPVRQSTQLTIGTPDANGRPASAVSSIRLSTKPGNAGPPDDAEVGLHVSITDVRNASDLSDYTGSLEARFGLRITDRSNTPYPGGPGPGTVSDFTYTFAIPCTATVDTATGSTCDLETTADALSPGTVIEGRRASWQVGEVEVRDSGGQPFLRQGLFVP